MFWSLCIQKLSTVAKFFITPIFNCASPYDSEQLTVWDAVIQKSEWVIYHKEKSIDSYTQKMQADVVGDGLTCYKHSHLQKVKLAHSLERIILQRHRAWLSHQPAFVDSGMLISELTNFSVFMCFQGKLGNLQGAACVYLFVSLSHLFTAFCCLRGKAH